MNAITLDGVRFAYANDPVITDISLEVEPGRTVCFTGENGCGKSTLLKLIIGDLAPDEGRVEVLGERVHGRRALKELGYVPQKNVIGKNSFPITAQEIVVQGLAGDFGIVKIPRRRHQRRALEALQHMGLGEYADTPFGELSGGLQQRVMITRALINDPEIIVLDEPTAGVDKESREEFLRELDRLHSERGLTVVMVTHDVAVVQENMHVDDLFRIESGRLADA